MFHEYFMNKWLLGIQRRIRQSPYIQAITAEWENNPTEIANPYLFSDEYRLTQISVHVKGTESVQREGAYGEI